MITFLHMSVLHISLWSSFTINENSWISIFLQIEASLNRPIENLLICFFNLSLFMKTGVLIIAWCQVQYYIIYYISHACSQHARFSQFAIYFISHLYLSRITFKIEKGQRNHFSYYMERTCDNYFKSTSL